MQNINNIIRDYGKNVQGLIMSITGNKHAQDLEQEVYIKVWKNLEKYKEKGNLWAWVKRITVNTCKDHLKSKQHNQEQKTDFDDEKYLYVKDEKLTPEKQLMLRERHNNIIDSIESLKPKFKEVVILYDIEEMSYEEISQKINCPVGTVKSRLFNARKQLQIQLEERRII